MTTTRRIIEELAWRYYENFGSRDMTLQHPTDPNLFVIAKVRYPRCLWAKDLGDPRYDPNETISVATDAEVRRGRVYEL